MKKIDKNNIDGLIKKNPKVDQDLLAKAQKEVEELRKVRGRKFDYNLVTPYSRRVRAAID
ncbi:MAG TPA: hypothetical protein VEF34_04850 [Syntrophobacteraceae bacterium]|nr:hypothetical protein [Syntrophobacteraceae bacterium]